MIPCIFQLKVFSFFNSTNLTEKPIIVPISYGTCNQTLFKVNHPHALL